MTNKRKKTSDSRRQLLRQHFVSRPHVQERSALPWLRKWTNHKETECEGFKKHASKVEINNARFF